MKEYNFIINGNDYTVSIQSIDDTTAEVLVNGTAFSVEFDMGKQTAVKRPQVDPIPKGTSLSQTQSAARPAVAKQETATSSGDAAPVNSPLPGVILQVNVKPGDTIEVGHTLVVLEAMKMENNIDALRAGVVQSVEVAQGDSVLEGDVLIMMK